MQCQCFCVSINKWHRYVNDNIHPAVACQVLITRLGFIKQQKKNDLFIIPLITWLLTKKKYIIGH